MLFFHRNAVKNWLAPLIVAMIVFGVVQPTFAQVVQPPPTLAQYLAGGGVVSVGLGSRSEGFPFPQVYYEMQGQRFFVTNTNYVNAEPSTAGDTIVWMGQVGSGWQIFLHDMPTGSTLQLTAEGNNVNPKISGDYIVWEGWVDGGWQIFLHNGASTRQIVQGDDSNNVEVYGNVVVFNRRDSSGEWRAVTHTIGTSQVTVVKRGILSKFPHFYPDGTLAFRAEEENKLYQSFVQAREDRIATQPTFADGEDSTSEGVEEGDIQTIEDSFDYFGITGCPVVVKAVCADDGVSYINACVAIWAGSKPSSVGACEGQPIQTLMPWSDNYGGGGFGLTGVLSEKDEEVHSLIIEVEKGDDVEIEVLNLSDVFSDDGGAEEESPGLIIDPPDQQEEETVNGEEDELEPTEEHQDVIVDEEIEVLDVSDPIVGLEEIDEEPINEESSEETEDGGRQEIVEEGEEEIIIINALNKSPEEIEELLRAWEKDMEEAADDLNFERAAQLRDRIQRVEKGIGEPLTITKEEVIEELEGNPIAIDEIEVGGEEGAIEEETVASELEDEEQKEEFLDEEPGSVQEIDDDQNEGASSQDVDTEGVLEEGIIFQEEGAVDGLPPEDSVVDDEEEN